MPRLLLGELVGQKQNSPARRSRPATRLGLRDTRSEDALTYAPGLLKPSSQARDRLDASYPGASGSQGVCWRRASSAPSKRFGRGDRVAALQQGQRLRRRGSRGCVTPKEQSGDGRRDCCSVTDGVIRQPGRRAAAGRPDQEPARGLADYCFDRRVSTEAAGTNVRGAASLGAKRTSRGDQTPTLAGATAIGRAIDWSPAAFSEYPARAPRPEVIVTRLSDQVRECAFYERCRSRPPPR